MYKSCWCLSIILALQMLHDSNFEASLKYIVEKPYLDTYTTMFVC